MERTQAGLGRAKKHGKRLGRPSAISEDRLPELLRRRAEGLSLDILAKEYGISRSAIARAEKRAGLKKQA